MPILNHIFSHEPTDLATAVIILRLEGSNALNNGGWKSSQEVRAVRAETGALTDQLPGNLGMATAMHARATALLPRLAAGLDEHGLDVPALKACLKRFPKWDASDLEILQSARKVIDDWASKVKARVNVSYELAKGLKPKNAKASLPNRHRAMYETILEALTGKTLTREEIIRLFPGGHGESEASIDRRIGELKDAKRITHDKQEGGYCRLDADPI